MSREVDLSAIKDAIDGALKQIDAYLDEELTPRAIESDVRYAESLKGTLESMSATIAAECNHPHFRPTLREEG